ncbi:MAG TPA: ATP-binding protein [Rhizomicrobium sp.]|jgi:nitrogen fixation/metabolism regulation signal transduction histidine kinase|nr:ATP-binding protein [Rhizomicrobium sp.]
MGSDSAHATLLPIAWRTFTALAFAVLAVRLVMTTQLYATIFFLSLLTLGLMFGVARLVLQVEGAAESHAANRTITRLQAEQKCAAQAQDHLQALLDTVSAALLVVTEDGRVADANRAARLLMRGEGPRLSAITAIGVQAAETIARLVPGQPVLVRLAAGQQMFASAGFFSSGGGNERLVSLQAVVGELDALQLKAWEDMSRVLAHEIMNSLTPIASLSESLSGMIRQEGASREVVEAMDTIARRSQGLAGFVARYRQVAELPEPKLQTVSLRTLADDVQSLMRERLDGVQYNCRVETLSVIADPDLLGQAVINLLHNAVDAVADVETPAVELACTREDEAVVISVADNGKGIPAQFREDIFVPFFTTKTGGSGIGLSVVRQIALKHGGWVSAAPNAAGGASFKLVLPLR